MTLRRSVFLMLCHAEADNINDRAGADGCKRT